MKKACSLWLGLVLLALAGCATSGEFGGGVPRMDAGELKSRLDDGDVVVIDVRHETHWEESRYRIRGAVREDPRNVSWSSRYPREKTIVLYCA